MKETLFTHYRLNNYISLKREYIQNKIGCIQTLKSNLKKADLAASLNIFKDHYFDYSHTHNPSYTHTRAQT